MSAGQSDIEIKLNLESFFVQWIWITLLGLTSIEVQRFTSLIFFSFNKIHHKSLNKKDSSQTSWKMSSCTYSVKKSHRQSNHLDKCNSLRWFLSHTLKILGKCCPIFSWTRRQGSILSEKKCKDMLHCFTTHVTTRQLLLSSSMTWGVDSRTLQ